MIKEPTSEKEKDRIALKNWKMIEKMQIAEREQHARLARIEAQEIKNRAKKKNSDVLAAKKEQKRLSKKEAQNG